MADEKRKTLRERLAEWTPEERRRAMAATGQEDIELRAQGLLDHVDERAEVMLIVEERLPVWLETAQSIAADETSFIDKGE